ncbi:MAG TPA: imidazolonepropionase [Gemmatimonadaceae bacterium]|nr:imidazolonepropionase [Gemmatimonadaceae bacterium]
MTAARPPRSLLLTNARQVVTCAGPARARRGAEMRSAGVVDDGAVLVSGDRITAVGPRAAVERAAPPDAERVDCDGGVLLPGFVDSHTHALFGRPRFEEQELRALGADYMEIARRGGGIHASVRDLRERPEDDLVALARARLRRLAAAGVTTVEVKSGYGLTVEDELKSLRAIRRLAAELPMRLVPTWLGAHEIPLEYRDGARSRAEYVRLLVEDMLPRVAGEGLARFADVFCEDGVYDVAESRRILTAARQAGLGLKLHADELRPSGGAQLAVELGATSADHLAAATEDGVALLAASGTVATMLPGTMLFLGKTRQGPARAIIDAGGAVALATDFNPGTSPTTNFPLMLTLGVSQLRLSVAESVTAGTVNGAAALGLAAHVGQLAPGFSADMALFACQDVREIPYWYGDVRCRASWARGKACHHFDLGLT